MGIKTNLLPERARLENGDSFLVDTAAGTGRLGIGNAKSQFTRNRNLLRNWYFADPIDQRHGYFVNSGVTYYSDEGLATSAGTTSAAMTAKYVNATYGTVTIDGTTYYVAAADVVRGYEKVWSYSIDRWILSSGGSSLTVCNGYISLVGSIDQKFEHLPKGTYTASVMLRDGTLRYGTADIQELNDENSSVAIDNIGGFLWYGGHPAIRIQIPPNIDLIAAKLELGDHQTLAHQDASGNWVLNDPPPDKALELLKCQRYQYIANNVAMFGGTGITGITYVTISTPVRLRTNPTIVGTIPIYLRTINGLVTIPADSYSVYKTIDTGVVIECDANSACPRCTPVTGYTEGEFIFDANL